MTKRQREQERAGEEHKMGRTCGERVSKEDFIGSGETLIASWQGWTGHCWRLLWASFWGCLPKCLPLWTGAFDLPPPPPSDPHCSLLTSSTHSSHPSIHPSIRPTIHASPPTCVVPLPLFPPTALFITTSHYLCSRRKERKN